MWLEEHDHMPAGPSTGLRAEALARGRERLRSGSLPAEALAAAMLEAHALLRTTALH